MWDQPIFSALSFSISNFQLSCSLDGPLLKITIASLEGQHPKQITLSKMTSQNSGLELFFAQTQLVTPSNSHLDFNTNSKSSKTLGCKAMIIDQKLSRLQQTVRQLQGKLTSQSQSKKSLRKNPSQQGKFTTSNSRKNLMQQGFGLRQNEVVEYGQIIEREVQENAKLELLNGLLQQKIMYKESLIADLEKQLMDREELIRELAEKLITANMEKEEIFNEYEKILQSTVFHRNEDAIPFPLRDIFKREEEEYIYEMPEIDKELLSQPNEPLLPQPQQKQEEPMPQKHKD